MNQLSFSKKSVIIREKWRINREQLEKNKLKYKLKWTDNKYLSYIDVAIECFGLWLKLTGQYKKGIENAEQINVKELELKFKNLPDAFHNYKILHLTDLHIDTIPGFEEIIIKKIKKLNYDVCFWTGDYRKYTSGDYKQVKEPLHKIIKNTHASDGIFGLLGNHDTWQMVSDLEDMGIEMLINESIILEREKQNILITGTDDPHYFPSKYHEQALKTEKSLFKIALIHSPEMYEEAAANAYNLYLCGHTHAGQVCLPNGFAPLKNLKKGKRFLHGLWKYKSMLGYTSPGCGVSGLPVRFNTQGEVTLITLKKEA
ncbi:metallophosphoesterase [Chondrinema litorale]|uniref:metallophosphoesterase n=1 Tax=Chondrinema litorale TaxID=2994555 RepID=UPI0025437A4A|nr:metallophosphoesterase [Chondrinema litorale]UZR96062.1 metallophosphoesterase [Chondrinema litorale]